MTSSRLNTFPQMCDYDQMSSGVRTPYTMLSGPSDYSSQLINTDSYGFRKTIFNGKAITLEESFEFKKVNLIIGGSTVFGVGATSDANTISSILSEKTGELWVNFGLRGGNSFQELIHLFRFIDRYKNVGNIIFFSGVNDVYVNFLMRGKSQFDHYFNEIDLDLAQATIKRQLLCKLFSAIHKVPAQEFLNLKLVEMLSYSKKEPTTITLTNPAMVLDQIISRNFFLYSSIQEKSGASIRFILQPFFYWSGKEMSEDESKVFQELEQMQVNTSWSIVKQAMSSKSTYATLLNMYRKYSKLHGVPFYDSNPIVNQPDTLFVDSVHLNDTGNNLAAQKIIELISKNGD